MKQIIFISPISMLSYAMVMLLRPIPGENNLLTSPQHGMLCQWQLVARAFETRSMSHQLELMSAV
jgi:hypothetical protein